MWQCVRALLLGRFLPKLGGAERCRLFFQERAPKLMKNRLRAPSVRGRVDLGQPALAG